MFGRRSKIKEWCGSILNGIKAFFGIHSPSTVIKEEVVKEGIIAGAVEGFEEGTPEVEKAVDNMAEAVMDEMDKALDAMQERIDAAKAELNALAEQVKALNESENN